MGKQKTKTVKSIEIEKLKNRKMNIDEYIIGREKILEEIYDFSLRNQINFFIAFDDTTKRRVYTMKCGENGILENLGNYEEKIEINPSKYNLEIPLYNAISIPIKLLKEPLIIKEKFGIIIPKKLNNNIKPFEKENNKGFNLRLLKKFTRRSMRANQIKKEHSPEISIKSEKPVRVFPESILPPEKIIPNQPQISIQKTFYDAFMNAQSNSSAPPINVKIQRSNIIDQKNEITKNNEKNIYPTPTIPNPPQEYFQNKIEYQPIPAPVSYQQPLPSQISQIPGSKLDIKLESNLYFNQISNFSQFYPKFSSGNYGLDSPMNIPNFFMNPFFESANGIQPRFQYPISSYNPLPRDYNAYSSQQQIEENYLRNQQQIEETYLKSQKLPK